MDSSEDGDALKKGDSDGSISELLNFTCCAQTLISELLLLSGRVPHEFGDSRFDSVLFDLRYLDSPDDFEEKIESNSHLAALDDQLRETCSVFLQRFLLLMNGIALYYRDLVKYLNDLQEGVYVQSTLDSVLEMQRCRQLLSESLVLFGVLLLLLEHRMGGTLREKLLVAFMRLDGSFGTSNLDLIRLLCRAYAPGPGSSFPSSTAFMPSQCVLLKSSFGSMISVQKPEDLFARFPFPKTVVDSIVSCLLHDDLYSQICHYPDPEHRTVALATQAGYLYILLCYSPHFLHDAFVMREIVDRLFKDSWVVPIFMYFTIDLSLSWEKYKVARSSLSFCLSPANVRDICQMHYAKVKDLSSKITSAKSDITRSVDYVLSNSQTLLSLVRNCNVSLRWLFLHRSTSNKKLRDIVISVGDAQQIGEDAMIILFLETSKVEFEVKKLYSELLGGKDSQWKQSKNKAAHNMLQLSEYLSSSGNLSSEFKDESLKGWFGDLSSQINSLDYKTTTNVGQKLNHMIFALKEVGSFHQIEGDFQVKQHLCEIQTYLQDMLKTLSLQKRTLDTISVISNSTYVWGFVGSFVEKLHKSIEKDSSTVLKLQPFFLKLHSMLEAPVFRLSQGNSVDLQFVSEYYSSELVAYICAILEIIPVTMFNILNDDFACNLQPLNFQYRMEKDNLQNLLVIDTQYQLAKAATRIATLSKGILCMSRTFQGIIDLDVAKWLEREIRKELSKRISNILNSFRLLPSVKLQELEENVRALMVSLHTQFQLLEILLGFVHVQGQHIWEEELTFILNHSLQQEYCKYVERRKQDLCCMQEINNLSNPETFLGRLLHQILLLTHPSQSMFLEPMSGWFDAGGHELLGLHFFDLFESCVGPFGLSSLDCALYFLIVGHLEQALSGLRSLLDTRFMEDFEALGNALGPATSIPLLGLSSYDRIIKMTEKSWEQWVVCLAYVGQLQLLRCVISSKLKSACKVNAGAVSFAVEQLVDSLFHCNGKDVDHERPSQEKYTDMESFLHQMNKQRMLCGSLSPLRIQYIAGSPPSQIGRFASIVTISQLSRYVLDIHLGALTCRTKKLVLDFCPLIIGLGTFLRQNDSSMRDYVKYMGQYVRTLAETTLGHSENPYKRPVDPTSEVLKSAFWLMYFCKYMEVPKDLLDSCLPPSLLSILEN
ncbi:hypothetical protein AMTRI_Chr06g171230 [Amborella trichopoda]